MIKDRIVEFTRVPAHTLMANPKNWRTHSENQRMALRGVLSEIGFADALLARENEDGSLVLIDGHLRADVAEETMVPVLVLDVTEAEGDKLLATLDPLAAMAGADAKAYEALIETVHTNDTAVAEMIAKLAADIGVYESTAVEQVLNTGGSEVFDAPMSGVRMVQLFLDDSNINEFQNLCAALQEAYGATNLTDTVFEAVRRAHSSL